MTERVEARRYRFGGFEADAATGELRRQGVRVRIHAQPFQVLMMLVERPGEVVTREEISRELWPDGTFVDYEHGVNSAVNRVREALGDKANSPRFVETLARKGYRFVAPVERIEEPAAIAPHDVEVSSAGEVVERRFWPGALATPEDLPRSSHTVVQTLFVALQVMYVGFYVGALANLAEIHELLSPLSYERTAWIVIVASAAVLIPVRVFLVCMVLFRAPRAREKFLKMWPGLLVMDMVWALSPALLLHHINLGLAIAAMTLLVYSPFAQRALMLMGAAES
ncbi:MAG TPA: winged helix-turn-helix domain-containing protein [Acidobacteriaceae bacterium]|nr:winged helix-turn-helix domain-containing protein [Acidobacteriaceae bacterium]